MDEEDLMELKEGQKLETRQGFGLDQVGGESTNGKEAEYVRFLLLFWSKRVFFNV